MSRSNYTDDFEGDWWSHICWRGAVTSALRGKRGQQLLCELRDALDAMPEKKLIADELVTEKGEYCALGVLGAKRGLDMKDVNPENYQRVAEMFGVAPAMVQEIVYMNDEYIWDMTPERRWTHMRAWVEKHIIPTPVAHV